MKLLRDLELLALAAVLLCFCSCESQLAGSGSSNGRFAQAPNDRPGLGTKWGETRKSSISVTDFHRADPAHPFAMAAIYYNDEAGIRAMAGTVAWQHAWPVLPSPMQNLVSIGLKGPMGFFYPGLFVGDRWFVVGEEGHRYSIFVENRSDFRLEIVLSVDGLDVVDGKKASLRKRGYVLDPHSRLKVEGFRQSSESVAAFRFSSVRESYTAEKYGKTGNVGVIGIAVFDERGANLPTGREVQKRLGANPFPGSFATPP
jgi:hypothetical protein